MLDLLRGKKWVLSPHAVEVIGGGAKANIFQVPGGYVVPLTFGGSNQEVLVTIRGVAGITAAEVSDLVAVPEPASFSLLLLGGLPLLVRRRNRNA